MKQRCYVILVNYLLTYFRICALSLREAASDVSGARCTRGILTREFRLAAPDRIETCLFSHLRNDGYL